MADLKVGKHGVTDKRSDCIRGILPPLMLIPLPTDGII
jgi:hypothetical protein